MSEELKCTCDKEYGEDHESTCVFYNKIRMIPNDGTDGDICLDKKIQNLEHQLLQANFDLVRAGKKQEKWEIEEEQFKNEIVDLKEQIEKMQLGDYSDTHYHDLHCNANRSLSMGCQMCSCFMYQRAKKAENIIKKVKEMLKEKL